MGYLLDQMEKVASLAGEAMTKRSATANPQASSNDARTERLLNGIAGGVGVAGAGGVAASLPKQFEMLQHNALEPMRAAWLGLTHTKGSEARRFLAQEKSMLRNAHKALRAGDEAKATKIVKQIQSPTHRAWRGFKSMSLPGKLRLLAPVLGTAAGAVGLGATGIYGFNKAING